MPRARTRTCRRCPSPVGWKRFLCDSCVVEVKIEQREKNRLKMAELRKDPKFREAQARSSADYRRRHPDRAREARRRSAKAGRLRRLYGLSLEDMGALLLAHGWRCAICRAWTLLHVDHDHDTGRVRGLLCGSCNRAIGQLGESPSRIRAAADYLETAVS